MNEKPKKNGRHIRMPGGKLAWCGIQLDKETTFKDLDEAEAALTGSGRIKPCRKCWNNIHVFAANMAALEASA